MTAAKRPGRPRAFDSECALDRLVDRFWQTGLSGTSLDDLVAATGIHRPSLYAAFGDKKAIYLKSLARYGEQGRAILEDALAADRFEDGLLRAYRAGIALYVGNDARGCFLLSTAPAEATTDADVRAALLEGVRGVDASFEARIRRAVKDGELDSATDVPALAQLATAVLHALALRARAGVSRPKLEALARSGVAMLSASSPRRSA